MLMSSIDKLVKMCHIDRMKDNIHYKAISEFYLGKSAKRSGVPYMNHIDEGLVILKKIGASLRAKEAYCIHPLLQSDVDLKASLIPGSSFLKYKLNARTIMYAMEYRAVANDYLSNSYITNVEDIKLSPIQAVNDMLIADKVQNYKDFCLYHKNTHERKYALDRYFLNWFQALGVDKDGNRL